jgi:hypothetical protein
MLADGLDNRIRGSNPANVERLQHLNNARALVVRDLELATASRISTDNTSRAIAPEPVRQFQLPDELQGVDPALIGSYNVLPVAASTLARSSGSPELRTRIAADLGTIGSEIIAALTASKAFNSGNGRGGRGGPAPGGGETLAAALNRIANGLDYQISLSRPENAERLKHLNNARAIAGRSLTTIPAAGPAPNVLRSAPDAMPHFQLPDDLQGVDPGLIITYNNLNLVSDALARSSVDPAVRTGIVSDLNAISNEIIAALTASKSFNGNGRNGRGGKPQ